MAAVQPTSEPLRIDTHFSETFNLGPRFTELKPIGYGANGLVFSGIDVECDKRVAIKKISFHDKMSCRCALREIKIMRGMENRQHKSEFNCISRLYTYRLG